jgi:hypothetical protein
MIYPQLASSQCGTALESIPLLPHISIQPYVSETPSLSHPQLLFAEMTKIV